MFKRDFPEYVIPKSLNVGHALSEYNNSLWQLHKRMYIQYEIKGSLPQDARAAVECLDSWVHDSACLKFEPKE